MRKKLAKADAALLALFIRPTDDPTHLRPGRKK
jgi:hypothetical protein